MLRPPLICSVWEGFMKDRRGVRVGGSREMARLQRSGARPGRGNTGGRVLVQGPH